MLNLSSTSRLLVYGNSSSAERTVASRLVKELLTRVQLAGEEHKGTMAERSRLQGLVRTPGTIESPQSRSERLEPFRAPGTHARTPAPPGLGTVDCFTRFGDVAGECLYQERFYLVYLRGRSMRGLRRSARVSRGWLEPFDHLHPLEPFGALVTLYSPENHLEYLTSFRSRGTLVSPSTLVRRFAAPAIPESWTGSPKVNGP